MLLLRWTFMSWTSTSLRNPTLSPLLALSLLLVTVSLNCTKASVVHQCPHATPTVDLHELDINITQESHEPQVSHVYSLVCPSTGNFTEDHGQHQTSTCPWNIINDTDYDRLKFTLSLLLNVIPVEIDAFLLARQQRIDTHSKEINVKIIKPIPQFTDEVIFCLESHAS
ncbi:hypothetical protein PoB_006421600 [Plakobranchus ocellatus]|uniref:Phosphatidylinositol-glycan biosynthesis class X protein n=1 Tax=Plakobranchus ocellatus TaxID=259542 RepID=A0AAV4D144_9GAST|nr:hypothetical protein PoB_006421600 [Plakobranchus ocellatus]